MVAADSPASRKAAYLRVKVWRRLQEIGAASVKNAVCALPASESSATQMQELLGKIAAGGGEALLCRAELVDGLTDTDMRALFDAARDADYEELVQEARALLSNKEISAAQAMRLRTRRDEIGAIDFFGAYGGQVADVVITELEKRARRHPDVGRAEPAPTLAPSDLNCRVWVRRRGVHVERIASAWLIRRFVDPNANFVNGKGYTPVKGELRFDMADAQLTHEDDRCTFETVVQRTELDGNGALRAIAEIVHDLDIADGKFNRLETAGVGALITGMSAAADDDNERLARGALALALEDLYTHSQKSRGA